MVNRPALVLEYPAKPEHVPGAVIYWISEFEEQHRAFVAALNAELSRLQEDINRLRSGEQR